ncbi:MAG: sigma-70 family RNA polymerase sigma factor [Pseudomonadota bacterium]
MASIYENKDVTLVGQCLSGSEPAWTEFYSRFERLVKMVVRRRLHVSEDAIEDVVHEIFISLLSGLKNYNSSYSLQNFVCTVAERVCVDQYRFSKASKRHAETYSLDDEDSGISDQVMKSSNHFGQEEELIVSQEGEIVRQALRLIGMKCRELLRLRYYDEAPYSRIAELTGVTENTLTVQTARCIRELRNIHRKLVQNGYDK